MEGKSRSIQGSLELAVSTLGVGHRTTLMISEERDTEIEVEQRRIYDKWLKTNLVKRQH